MLTTSFLSLPREIRDEIYRIILLPRSAPYLIEPWRVHRQKQSSKAQPKAKSKARSRSYIQSPSTTQRFKIALNPVGNSPIFLQHLQGDEDVEHTTLSLLRVNKQIHAEAHNLFWANAIFYFYNCHFDTDQRYSLGVVKLLKGIGQTPSRLIRQIRINFDFLVKEISEMTKVLQLLASRARFGAFERLDLQFDDACFAQLVEINSSSPSMGVHAAEWTAWYDQLLDALRKDSAVCSYQRVMHLPENYFRAYQEWKRWGYNPGDAEETIRVLHFACGGKLYLGDKLVWDNYHNVAEFDAVQAEYGSLRKAAGCV